MLAKTVKSPCCNALVAWSYYWRLGDDKKGLHRFCSECARYISRGIKANYSSTGIKQIELKL